MEFEEKTSSSISSQYSRTPSALLAPCSSSPSQPPSHKQKRKAGRKKFKETRHPIYRGVRQRNGKWVCELRQPHKKPRIWLGTFSLPEMAARAHDVAVLALRGESASLNFPQVAHLLPRPTSSSVRDIRNAANAAAQAYAHDFEYTSSSSSSMSSIMEIVEKVPEASGRLFLDEEALFNLPGLLDNMAEGLILNPPAMEKGFNWDGVDTAIDLTLWSE